MNSLSRICASLAFALLASIVSAPSAVAQSIRTPMAVKIPFGFENGSHHLPPGRYTLSLTRDNILSIRGDTDGTNFVIWDDYNARPADHSKLVFHKLGDRYFLREIWLAGSSSHSICTKSAGEKQEEIAQSRRAPQAPQVAVLETVR